jgi:hypothetical protein
MCYRCRHIGCKYNYINEQRRVKNKIYVKFYLYKN